MSLDKFLKDTTVTKQFKEYFPVPATGLDSPLLVPLSGVNPQLLGSAFDYLLRFYIQGLNKNLVSRRWVAEYGWFLLYQKRKDCLDAFGDSEELNKIPEFRQLSEDCDYAWKTIDKAKILVKSFVKTGKLERELIKSSIKLAQLDLIVRRLGKGRSHMRDRVSTKHISEMEMLYGVAVKSKIFQSKRRCYLNPYFDESSELIGGADADLIIGDTLIDIKTVKDLSFTQGMYNQLISYYILSEIRARRRVRINNVGVYFSRYGVLHTLPVAQIKQGVDFNKFVRWFKKKARELKK